MSREEAVGLIVASFVAILAAGLSMLGWYVNRRVAAWASVLQRLAAVEAKANLVDVAGTHGNRVAIDQLRRDIEALEDLHRKDLIDVDRRIASSTLSMAQLAERVNAYAWRGQPGRQSGDRSSGPT